MKLRVCPIKDILDGELIVVPVDGLTVDVLVTKVDGVIVAGSSMCPHEDVSLQSGRIDSTSIRCSAHGYTFDLRTGQCDHDSELRWRVYKTSIIAEDLYIELF